MADHLTFSLLKEGYCVYKCVPYAPTNVIVPYLIRRAKEAKTSLESVHLQYRLMKAELKYRLNPFTKSRWELIYYSGYFEFYILLLLNSKINNFTYIQFQINPIFI